MGLNPTILRQAQAFAFLFQPTDPPPRTRRPYRASGLVLTSVRDVLKRLKCANSGHVWTYMGPARLQAGLANSGPRVTTADVYPASLCGVSDRRRREPRWIFARFHLNGAKALAEVMPVQTPGSGSDGVTVSPSSANRCNC